MFFWLGADKHTYIQHYIYRYLNKDEKCDELLKVYKNAKEQRDAILLFEGDAS